MPSLVPSALLSGAELPTAMRKQWLPHLSDLKGTDLGIRVTPEGKPLMSELGTGMATKRKHSFKELGTLCSHVGHFLFLESFPRFSVPTEKMTPGSWPGLQPFILEMNLGGGSRPLSLVAPYPCGN